MGQGSGTEGGAWIPQRWSGCETSDRSQATLVKSKGVKEAQGHEGDGKTEDRKDMPHRAGESLSLFQPLGMANKLRT